jgi:hypothetical protein
LARFDARKHSLKFTSRNDDRIDILSIQDSAKVLIHGPLTLGFSFELFGSRFIAIAQSN